MPRGQKSKARAREKRRQVQEEAEGLKDAPAKAAENAESCSCSDQASGDARPSTCAAGFPQHSQSSAPSNTGSKAMARRGADKGDQSQGDENKSFSRAPLATGSPQMDLLTRKTGILMEYMLCKYKVKQPMKRGEMLKVVNKRFKEQFPEILKKASHLLDMVFGLELKEVQSHGQTYILVSKLDFQDDGSESSDLQLPTRGILIPLLSVIYLHNYCAPEKEVWHFLNMLGVHDGASHLIYGDIRKLITEDLVQEHYLQYTQVPNSDPPSYEFLWGPRAYAEASQVKVMDFLAKISETMPGIYSSPYEQALIEEEEKAQAEAAAKAGTKGKAKKRSKSKFSNPTP